METLVFYLMRSVLVSGLMFGYYQLALRNRRLHSFNRAWLLTALLASLVLPLIHPEWLTWHTAARSMAVLVTGSGAHPPATRAFSVLAFAGGACFAISGVLLAILGFRILRVYRLKRGHQTQRIEGCVLIEVQDRRAPFSFLKNLFWQEGADICDPFNRKILDHELAHIRGGHTYDTLFAQTLAAVCWMNPFFWLIRRELQMVHEFIADDASIASGDTETFAQMLLRSYDGGRYLDPSHSFYFSPIKRRLRMISSFKSPSRWRMALALPILLAVVALACSKEQGAQPAQAREVQLKYKTLILNLVKDSVRVQFAGQIKKILFLTQKGGKDSVRLDFKGEVATIVPDGERVVNLRLKPKTGQDIEVLAPPHIERDKQ